MKRENKKAVVLLSGGIDSATTLFYAKNLGYKCHALIFDYGQRHKKEIIGAKKIARISNTEFSLLKIPIQKKGSSLTDKNLKIPRYRKRTEIPPTYVPARNLIFLSFAFSFAETIRAKTIFIGANIIDYSGYPDCRPEFLRSMEKTAGKGTKAGTTGKGIKIRAPLIKKPKAEIIKLAIKLNVPLKFTWSCYMGGKKPCGWCDSCIIRAEGFRKAGFKE